MLDISIELNGKIVETYRGSEFPSEGLFIYVKPLQKTCLIIKAELNTKENKGILYVVE